MYGMIYFDKLNCFKYNYNIINKLFSLVSIPTIPKEIISNIILYRIFQKIA